MTDTELLRPFDADVIRTVAKANDIEIEPLRETLADHQRTMQQNPGVENLVYEWRKQYDDPVLARTDTVFIVAVLPTVWEEYGDYLDIDPPLLRAVTAAHQEQTLRTPDISLSGMPPDHAALVVGREP